MLTLKTLFFSYSKYLLIGVVLFFHFLVVETNAGGDNLPSFTNKFKKII